MLYPTMKIDLWVGGDGSMGPFEWATMLWVRANAPASKRPSAYRGLTVQCANVNARHTPLLHRTINLRLHDAACPICML